jgi:hypothetical protein
MSLASCVAKYTHPTPCCNYVLQFSLGTKYISRDLGNKIMAAKKAAAKKPKGDANYDMLDRMYGSDTGVRNKAAVAQKKSQAATSAKTNKGASYLKSAASSKKNDLAGASGRGGTANNLGRTSTRAYNQVANSFRPLVKEGKARKASAAKVAKGKK